MNREIETNEQQFGDDPSRSLSTADIAGVGERSDIPDDPDMHISAQSHVLRHEILRRPEEPTPNLTGTLASKLTPPQGAAGAASAKMPARTDGAGPLFAPEEASRFRDQWDSIQVNFVDEPRHAVEQADALVAETIKRLAHVFADERRTLERQWGSADGISTEDLRLALRRYRSFFGRLLSV